jgi:hypothetical protein
VSEKLLTGGKPSATRTSRNTFEVSRSEKPQYFVDTVQDKRTKNNNLEFLIGCRDTYPLMWWKQHQQEFPDLTRMARQYLTVPATSVSPERFFSRVGLVQTDVAGESSGHHHG